MTHFHEFEGSLWDDRDNTILRRNYAQCRHHVRSIADVKAALRHGEYAWPGGYQMYFVTSDGAALSFETVRAEWANVVQDHMDDNRGGGWHIAGVDINYEDPDLHCDHSGKRIESAYAED